MNIAKANYRQQMHLHIKVLILIVCLFDCGHAPMLQAQSIGTAKANWRAAANVEPKLIHCTAARLWLI